MSVFTPFALEDHFNEVEGLCKLDLSPSGCPPLSFKQLIKICNKEDSWQDELLNCSLEYGQAYGNPKLVTAIKESFYANPETQILSTLGAAEAINVCFNSLFNQGDVIIVQKPIYQSLFQIAQDRGVQIISWYQGDLQTLEELIKQYPQVKALVINNPNNPLGTGFDDKELKIISKIIYPRILISDEVARGITEISPVADLYPNAVSIEDLSKSYSAPGLRCGWLATQNKNFLKQFLAYRNYTALRNVNLAELAGLWLIQNKKKVLTNNKKLVVENKKKFFKNLKDLPFNLDLDQKQIIGLCCFVKVQSADIFERAFKNGVLLIRGELIDDKYENYTRIGFGVKNFGNSLKLLLE